MSDPAPADGRPKVESRPGPAEPGGEHTVTLHPLGGKPVLAQPEPEVGAHWDDFELAAEIGRGGMGIVYRARQISLDRIVALKVMLRADATIASRLRREARALAQVDSAHVVRAYTAGVHRNQPYLVMEYVEGTDLSRKLKDGWQPTPDEAIALIVQAARGLSAAARHGIIHRDIKPGNMMIGADGVLKLTDFGLAHMADDEQLTHSGTVIGTTHYTSPEQGRGGVCDPRSDIYSLGVVLYQLLTGQLPFTGETSSAVIYQHIHAYPKSPRRLASGISRGHERIVMKCLRKSPSDRYQSADELIAECEALAQGLLPTWSPSVAVAAALAITLLALATWAMTTTKRQETTRPDPDPAPTVMVQTDQPAIAPVVAPVDHKPEVEEPVLRAPPRLGPVQNDEFGAFADLKYAGLIQRFRYCPPGRFNMGSPDYEAPGIRDETLHRVTLTRGFWLADTECTQAWWRAIMRENPSTFSGDELPVNRLSRPACERFIARLNKRVQDLRTRLPSEAEWEYACRAGTSDPFGGLIQLSNESACFGGTRPCTVKSFAPNRWGFYDMLGNVREWCSDEYAPFTSEAATDPLRSGTGAGVSRGGCWEDNASECRAARRARSWVETDAASIGIRLAIDAVEQP
jgi:formylglycine-generating enzyme required for sulfatase activity